MLLSQVIYPGLFRSLSNLVTAQFAKNVLNEHFRIDNLYPPEIVAADEQTYVPVKVNLGVVIYTGQ